MSQKMRRSPLRPRSRESHSTTEQMLEHGFADPRSCKLWRSGRVILKGKDKTEFRWKIFDRAQARCEIEIDGKCCKKYAPWSGPGHGDLVHIVASVHGGSDTIDNCLWGCRDCHKRKYHPGLQWTKRGAA